jgi:hypothetical protein
VPSRPKPVVMGRLVVALVVVAGLLPASPALADTTISSNWAGYAVHAAGVSFRGVEASWREPAVACRPGRRTFSSYWVGLGGYRLGSRAIEQIGTEADCTRFGVARHTAWYELLPAASRAIPLAVHPGDLVAAAVTVRRRLVSFSLRDLTTGRAFAKTVAGGRLDLSSAEWILEAPSDCLAGGTCVTLPLADFGLVSFLDARAEGRLGDWGSITDRRWHATKIVLAAGGRRFVSRAGSDDKAGGASPGAPAAGGTAFTVAYAAA